eukprot:4806630-Alexandrium_andersonii.AAC.1
MESVCSRSTRPRLSGKRSKIVAKSVEYGPLPLPSLPAAPPPSSSLENAKFKYPERGKEPRIDWPGVSGEA